MSPSSPAYAQEPSLEFPQIAPGVDLEDLDIPAPIVLSADQPIVAAVGTFADNPQTESEWLGFELGFRASYPTPDSSAGQAVLSVSVDGRTAVQILIQQDESGVTASGAGWLEGDKLIEGGLVDVEGEYANYLQTGTVAPGEVSVVLQLELPTDDSGLSVVVDPGSGFRRLDESPLAFLWWRLRRLAILQWRSTSVSTVREMTRSSVRSPTSPLRPPARSHPPDRK
jgi:uncharacterized protein (DUF3820 family)